MNERNRRADETVATLMFTPSFIQPSGFQEMFPTLVPLPGEPWYWRMPARGGECPKPHDDNACLQKIQLRDTYNWATAEVPVTCAEGAIVCGTCPVCVKSHLCEMWSRDMKRYLFELQ